ncbi:polyprenyl synthetase family protein [Streptomyces sp. NPDC020898]|uniref:polyprenyl synthetase family protein n=1 Tax=Streptomyces sp. NPDC020898 TaxID=3365101 RepID=UPI003794E762
MSPTSTSPLPLGADALDSELLRSRIDERLHTFLDTKCGRNTDVHLASLIEHVRGFLTAGGKRIRPLLCMVGWHAAGGYGEPDPVIGAAASLELFHAFTLIHDDVMDASETRRGRPTLHRALAAGTAEGGGPDTLAERFGANSAILLGDLVMVWSDELLYSSGLDHHQLAAARPLLDAMRTEVMIGQYRDLLATGRPTADVELALTVIRFKTAKYTVERPLHIGAVLAGADRALLDVCTSYALPIGEAFQLRDDLLGVFGDPAKTGKSALDDLREGKATALMAHALCGAGPEQARVLTSLVGDPELDEAGAETVRGLLRATGAVDKVEEMISERVLRARQVLDDAPFPDEVRKTLDTFATTATLRTT